MGWSTCPTTALCTKTWRLATASSTASGASRCRRSASARTSTTGLCVFPPRSHPFSPTTWKTHLSSSPPSLPSEYYHYRQAWIPLRWLPSESVFEDDFSTKSDVWAFGVLMWEVFSHGELPHAKLSDDEALEGQCDASDSASGHSSETTFGFCA